MNTEALERTGELQAMLRDSSNEDTREHPLRNSHLKAMGRSPLHCRHAILCDTEPTLAMRVGSGVHSLLLGGPPLACYPGKVRRGREYDAFCESQPDNAIVMTSADYDRSHRIAESVRRDPLAMDVLYRPGSVYEQTILWEQNGRARRCTPDVRSDTHLAELKSTRNAAPEKFRWDAIRMGYHGQLADYANAIHATTGTYPKDVFIVAVEQLPPFGVSVHRLTTRALDMGERMVRAWLELLLVCEETGLWPGYSQSVIEFDVDEPEEFVFDSGDDE
ncbi:MAG: PD-(D/E)XK nuclease-like domain-containing protein [Gemmatimonadaceae bacterium]|nr:PD-(D/E)XK nuclease-like domain-containing protein [Gemmatimonadaceae bacterium]